jgi:hypothetical protein
MLQAFGATLSSGDHPVPISSPSAKAYLTDDALDASRFSHFADNRQPANWSSHLSRLPALSSLRWCGQRSMRGV